MGTLKKIRYNCKGATLLIERKLITGLTLRQKAELRIHLYGCSVCRVFEKQSRLINIMVQQLFKSNSSNFHLEEGFKHKLQNRIEEELNKN
ncbi:hypothetical protein [Mucilaginibacter antarcticus]|uniref:Zinc finger protein n=1 Tax=Mucilaginibacter antarcticus TaxID=1855725 RepID=A0ABW5XIU6_9SPHI